jgi:hypothetical protein
VAGDEHHGRIAEGLTPDFDVGCRERHAQRVRAEVDAIGVGSARLVET